MNKQRDNLKCHNCDSDLTEQEEIVLEGFRNDEVIAYECSSCMEAFAYPEDFSEAIYHEKELEEKVLENSRGDEYKVECCSDCGFYTMR